MSIYRAVEEGQSDVQVSERINMIATTQDEKTDAIEYFKVLRETPVTVRDAMSSEAGLLDFFRALEGPANLVVPSPDAPGGDAPQSSRADESRTRPGPKQRTTRGDVEAAAARLKKDHRPNGERSIADELGVSRGAVRYALGKDRRQA